MTMNKEKWKLKFSKNWENSFHSLPKIFIILFNLNLKKRNTSEVAKEERI